MGVVDGVSFPLGEVYPKREFVSICHTTTRESAAQLMATNFESGRDFPLASSGTIDMPNSIGQSPNMDTNTVVEIVLDHQLQVSHRLTLWDWQVPQFQLQQQFL